MNRNILKFFYYFSLIILIIIYVYPGSIIGKILYGDLGKQPNFIPNPLGTSINHTLAFLYLTLVGGIIKLNKSLILRFIFLMIVLSVILETLHFIVPNRSFQIVDLLSNIFGVFLGYLILKLIIIFKK
tara:strand:- start:152 stop:535 length:384 start_codon:yes stop_codon:yes gene_type:complete